MLAAPAAPFLHALREYRAGRRVPPRPAAPVDVTEAVVSAQVLATLPSAVSAAVQERCGVCQAALKAVRQDEPARAAAIFAVVREAGWPVEVARTAPLFVETICRAGEAYLAYRLADFAAARALLHASLHATSALVEEYGCVFLEPRRVHLACNLMRVDRRVGRGDEVVAAAAGVLEVLRGHPGRWPYPASPIASFSPPEELREWMWNRTLEEPALVLSARGADPQQAAEVLRGSGLAGDPPYAGGWIALLGLESRGGTEAYLEAAGAWLAGGAGDSPVLWYAAALGLHRRCGLPGAPPAAAELRDEIARDLLASPSLPPELRRAVEAA